MRDEAQKAGTAPEKLNIILRINQSSKSAKAFNMSLSDFICPKTENKNIK